MSSNTLSGPIQALRDHRAAFERLWVSAEGVWRDAKRHSFQKHYVNPLVGEVAMLERKLEKLAETTARALRSLDP